MPLVSTVRINGPALRDLRQRQGLSVVRLAGKIGRHRQSITRLEIGNGKTASVVFAYQLANALGADLADFTLTDAADSEPAGAAA